MAGPEQVRDIVEGLSGQQLQSLGSHIQYVAAVDLANGDVLRCAVEPPVFGGVVSVLEDGLVDELGHGGLHDTGAHTAQRAWMISHPEGSRTEGGQLTRTFHQVAVATW